jgi:hypothetical protein
MEVQGKVIEVLPTQTGTSSQGNAWEKAGFVIETSGNYPKKIAFEVFNKPEVAERAKVGADVTVSVELESREYQGKWYTSARAWKVVANSAAPVQTQPEPAASAADGLPF